MTHPAENGLPPCEVHVPGRDAPSPWCAACRMSGATAENGAPYDPCHGDPRAGWHGAHGAWEPCPVCDPPRVFPPGTTRLGSCCVNVSTDACVCENPTNWGTVIPPEGTSK